MEERRTCLASCHPATAFLWYALVIVCAVMLQHPLYMIVTFCAAVLNYISIAGSKGIKIAAGFLPVFVVLSLLNPVFNTYGDHILFTYFGRNYTLEALAYGMVIAGMFVSVMLLFLGYSSVMTSDKFTTVFGKLIPALSLLLVMVLRLVPSYRRKADQINQARSCIGKGIGNDEAFSKKVENGMIILGALTGWALESSVVTADSMRSRGYGCATRTSFQLYQFRKRDCIFLVIFLASFAVTLAGMLKGAAKAAYTPEVQIQAVSGWYLLPVLSYILLLFLPVIFSYMEEVKWHILRSGI